MDEEQQARELILNMLFERVLQLQPTEPEYTGWCCRMPTRKERADIFFSGTHTPGPLDSFMLALQHCGYLEPIDCSDMRAWEICYETSGLDSPTPA